jgi:hypothetical protein
MTDLIEASELYKAGNFDQALELLSTAEAIDETAAHDLSSEIRLQRYVDIMNVSTFMQKLGRDLNSYKGFEGLVAVQDDDLNPPERKSVIPKSAEQSKRDEFDKWLESHLDMAYVRDPTLRWSVDAVKGKVIFIVNAQLDAYISRYHRYSAIHDGWFNPLITIGSFAVSSVFIGPKLWFVILPRAERDNFRDSGFRVTIDADGEFDFQVSRIDQEKKSQVKKTLSNKAIIELICKIRDQKLVRRLFHKKVDVPLSLIEQQEMKKAVIDDIIKILDGILTK